MAKRCAFLTMDDLGDFFAYDHLLIPPMRASGWEVVDVPWAASGVDWSSFEAVVIRSPWDYQGRPELFIDVLRKIDESAAVLHNPLEVCRWNMDKVYLRDLEARGVAIIPTQWCDSLTPDNLSCLLDQHPRLVVKPRIGAGADDTFVLDCEQPESWREALETYSGKPLLVQPFLPSIQTVGEVSLFYFAGQFSHAIVKCPSKGDFRVQEEHGGIIRACEPTAAQLELALRAVGAVGQELLYARIDVVQLPDGSQAIIELELIEPSLYFSFDDNSPGKFVDAFCSMMG